MKKDVKFFKCNHCGNIITVIKESGAPISCCGEVMMQLEANSTDAAVEKHVPVITKKDEGIVVTVGSVLHPMQPEHYIEWIVCVSEGKVEFRYLEPGTEPTVEYDHVSTGTVYAYCNLHGLWKAEF